MIAYLVRRLLQAVVVMLAVSLVSFFMFQHIGDPIENLLGQDATTADRAALVAQLGLDRPAIIQYFDFLKRTLSGEFGVSYRLSQPVSTLIAQHLPATLELVAIAAVMSLSAGLFLGVYSAIQRDSLLTRGIMTGSLVGISLPTFLKGIALIYLFSVVLGWLPAFGRGDVVPVGTFWTTGLLTASGWKSVLMPALTLSLFQTTLIMRLVRAEMLGVLRTDFIKAARARGIPTRSVYFGHALRNTLIPVITVVGLQLGSLIAFAMVTETVFQWPGVGLLFIESVQFVDVPVMAAYLMLIACLFVFINLIVDLLYLAVDPRMRVMTDRSH